MLLATSTYVEPSVEWCRLELRPGTARGGDGPFVVDAISTLDNRFDAVRVSPAMEQAGYRSWYVNHPTRPLSGQSLHAKPLTSSGSSPV
jgi:hypothetical protein